MSVLLASPHTSAPHARTATAQTQAHMHARADGRKLPRTLHPLHTPAQTPAQIPDIQSDMELLEWSGHGLGAAEACRIALAVRRLAAARPWLKATAARSRRCAFAATRTPAPPPYRPPHAQRRPPLA